VQQHLETFGACNLPARDERHLAVAFRDTQRFGLVR
jgi:hypothetical protein